MFFKFNRFWSFRNLDLILLILLAPGLLMVHYGMNPPNIVVSHYSNFIAEAAADTAADSSTSPDLTNQKNDADSNDADSNVEEDSANGLEIDQGDSVSQESMALPTDDANTDESLTNEESIKDDLSSWMRYWQKRGFIWLFSVGAIWLVRMLLDPSLVRKPFLESNLSSGGLVFLVCSLMIFLFANIITSRPKADDISGPRDAVKLMQTEQMDLQSLKRHGPGYALFNLFPTIPTFANDGQMLREDADNANKLVKYETAAKSMAILGQIAIVLGLVFFGRNHFDDLRIGIGMAAIYLMLPYTAENTGRVMHVLPAALLVWSITMYRVPLASGILLGLAGGVAYYPLFLIPLFVSYYWERGRSRFLIGLLGAIGLAVGSLIFTATDAGNFFEQLQAMFGFWFPQTSENLSGIWSLGWYPGYRITLMVGFIVMCITFAAWPGRKTLASLLCCSCAAMVAVQFWHGFEGGLCMAWYIPLGLLVFFRPNLEETTALQALPERK